MPAGAAGGTKGNNILAGEIVGIEESEDNLWCDAPPDGAAEENGVVAGDIDGLGDFWTGKGIVLLLVGATVIVGVTDVGVGIFLSRDNFDELTASGLADIISRPERYCQWPKNFW